jgi:hypothetical protein
MKLAVFASLLTCATAFAPVSQNKFSTALDAFAKAPTFEDKPGALPPLGYWDPLGLATSEEIFDQYRAVELKHGRVAMLAVIGKEVKKEFFEVYFREFFCETPLNLLSTSSLPCRLRDGRSLPIPW